MKIKQSKPKTDHLKSFGANPDQPGFALIITLSLLVLLTVIAFGLLTLSSITLRNTSRNSAQAEARANARLALQLAIGQLQTHAGDDRRITMAADQMTETADGSETSAQPGRRHWTGVYKSWADDSEDRPEPEFLSWLVSSPTPNSLGEDSPTLSDTSEEMVELVGSGTAGSLAMDMVEVPRIKVMRDGRAQGHMAWWTGDQGLKAMLAYTPVDPPAGIAEVRDHLQTAPGNPVELASTAKGRPFLGMDRSDPRLAALSGWGQAALIATERENLGELFHDIATHNSGLMVDVRKGGFRRDLSMRLENDQEPSYENPLYTLNGEIGINFEELRNFYQLYRELEPVAGNYTTSGSIPPGAHGFNLPDTPAQCMEDEAFHFKMPVTVSLQVVFSLQARPLGSDPDSLHRLYLTFDPVITLWNPLDVPIVIPQSAWLCSNFFQLPYTFDVSAGGNRWECPLVSSLSGATVTSNNYTHFLAMRMGQIEKIVLKPGEVIKLSQAGNLRFEGNRTNYSLQGQAGFNYGNGIARPLLDKRGNRIDLEISDTVSYTMRPNNLTIGKTASSGETLTGGLKHTRHFANMYHEFYVGSERPGQGGCAYGGILIDDDFGNTRADAYSIREAATPGTKPPEDRIYADRPQYANVFPSFGNSETRPLPVAQLASAKAPVLMYTFSAKTETSSPTGNRAMLRFNPRAHRIDFYTLDEEELNLKAFDIQMEALNSWVNRKLETSLNGNAYFGGGYNAADGNSIVITHSIPREPVHSLAALQHSTANGFLMQRPVQGYISLQAREPMLPQISHAIGNSFAPGVLSPDETSRIISGGRPVADHSYLANRALWDEWFFSSIAPQETANYSTSRTQRQVAEDFLNDSSPLPNTHYKPDLGGRDVDGLLDSIFDGGKPATGSENLIASLLRVEGMFNINSTSVEAWRVLLSNLNNQDIVTQNEAGELKITKIDEGVPVIGLLAPQDTLAKGQSPVPAGDPEQWAGRRVLSETEITLLAGAIVREIRKRGPFLSLADFVNRRVGSDTDLARAGAIQSALDSDQVPINEAYNTGSRAVSANATGGLPFPEAEEGAASAGIPGIVKQADILTPIAPILSARSDSFLIRAYGEAVDSSGSVITRAWCEAQVQRSTEFTTGTDPRETPLDQLNDDVNKTFGRRFDIISFRWLNSDEI